MLYKFGNFETEIDNTDISFLEKCFKGAEELKNVSIEGDMFTVVTEGCKAVDNYLNSVFGEGSTEKMFGDRLSLNERMKAVLNLADAINDTSETAEMIAKFSRGFR